jgi:hypothetical protein
MGQIPYEPNREPIDLPELLLNRISVQQGLGRMLPRSVPGVDHGYLTRQRGSLTRSGQKMTQHDTVGVALDGTHRIL